MDDTFKFDHTARKTRFTREQILDGLRAFDQSRPPNLRGTPFHVKDFNAWPDRPFNSKLAADRFGAWRFALAAAGLKGRFRGVYSTAELMDHIEQTWRKIERPPGRDALTLHTGITGETFTRRFGSIQRACERLALYKEGKITKAQLLRPASPNRPHPPHLQRRQVHSPKPPHPLPRLQPRQISHHPPLPRLRRQKNQKSRLTPLRF
jgi:hypothetical protein